MIIANYIALILVLLGALNWGLVGIFNFNLVESVFMANSVFSMIIYIVIAAAAAYLIVSCIINRKIALNEDDL